MTCSPNVHQYMHEINQNVLYKHTNCTVSEMPCSVDRYESSRYDMREFEKVLTMWQQHMLGNNGMH